MEWPEAGARPGPQGILREAVPEVSQPWAAEPDEIRFCIDEFAEIGAPFAQTAVAFRIPPDRLNWKELEEILEKWSKETNTFKVKTCLAQVVSNMVEQTDPDHKLKDFNPAVAGTDRKNPTLLTQF